MKTELSYQKYVATFPERDLHRELSEWLEAARALAPTLCDWIGIYFKESFLTGSPSTDLILGPFWGEPTEHTRIPISRGICGMALREERVVNVPDVRENSEHIACSLKTRSELVIPLSGGPAGWVAELDIDSNTLRAFSPDVEERLRNFAMSFPVLPAGDVKASKIEGRK